MAIYRSAAAARSADRAQTRRHINGVAQLVAVAAVAAVFAYAWFPQAVTGWFS